VALSGQWASVSAGLSGKGEIAVEHLGRQGERYGICRFWIGGTGLGLPGLVAEFADLFAD
jgi:hypothetical protein